MLYDQSNFWNTLRSIGIDDIGFSKEGEVKIGIFLKHTFFGFVLSMGLYIL